MGQTYRPPVEEGDRIRAGLAMQLIALPTGIPAEAMTSRERLSLRSTRARWLAMYLAHVGFGWPLERVGYAFGVNRATVGIGCRWAEDARDDPTLDALLDRLETAVRDICEAPRLELAA
jgi:chromosomal replication initiation ATPase DnaA